MTPTLAEVRDRIAARPLELARRNRPLVLRAIPWAVLLPWLAKLALWLLEQLAEEQRTSPRNGSPLAPIFDAERSDYTPEMRAMLAEPDA